MLRIVKHIRCRAVFNNRPAKHHRNPVCNSTNDPKIVGDEQHRHFDLLFDEAHLLEDLSLHSNIQSRCRLIGD